jgi:hypothetical protein
MRRATVPALTATALAVILAATGATAPAAATGDVIDYATARE